MASMKLLDIDLIGWSGSSLDVTFASVVASMHIKEVADNNSCCIHATRVNEFALIILGMIFEI